MRTSPRREPSRRYDRAVLPTVILKDRRSAYRNGTRAGWWKIKDPGWIEREAWRFER